MSGIGNIFWSDYIKKKEWYRATFFHHPSSFVSNLVLDKEQLQDRHVCIFSLSTVNFFKINYQ